MPPVGALCGARTLALMQFDYFYPKVADRLPLSEWEYRDSPDIIQSAKKRMKDIRSTHHSSYIDLVLAITAMRPGRWPFVVVI